MYAYAYGCGYIYMCIFCSECCMHFGTGVLDTSAWAGVYATQVCFYANVHICEHTRCRLCTYLFIYICVYACICVWMRMFVYLHLCICMHMCMDAYVRPWFCLTRWGVVTKIFYLCIPVPISRGASAYFTWSECDNFTWSESTATVLVKAKNG